MNSLISVIVPVYNVSEYLEKCFYSLKNQSYKNIEIILVDDGSKDDSGLICDKLLKIDDRVKVIHKKNGGLSSARNFGMELATGDYILFVDSDDWIEYDMIEILYNLIEEYDADISVGGVLKVWDNGKKEIMMNFPNRKVLNCKEALKSLLWQDNLNVAVWNKLYKKEIIKNILFAEGKINEDVDWSWKAIANSNKIVICNELLYNYRQRNGSIMSVSASSNYKFILDSMMERHQYLANRYPELCDDSIFNIIYSCLYQGQIFIKSHKRRENKKCINYLSSILNEVKFSDNYYKNISLQKKLRIKFIVNNLYLCCVLQNALKIGI